MISGLSLTQWLEKISTIHPKTIDLSLERVWQVGQKGNLLHFPCPVVTVGGTNGKGSTVAILALLLQEAGLKVATYTSPHLLYFNERIQLQGKCVTDPELIQAFAAIDDLRADILLTYFEFTTLAAFYIFHKHLADLDIIILEVGLGGRLDAVNAVNPSIAVISSIHYDHQAYLGETLEEIAEEKSGIFREQIPVVLSRFANVPRLIERALSNQNKLFLEGSQFGYSEKESDNWQFLENEIQLPKSNLPKNSLSLALATYCLLRDNFLSLPDIGNITHVLSGKEMVARMQQVDYQGIKLILDCAHNPQASKWLAEKLKSAPRSSRIIAVWASLSDKCITDIIEPLISCIDAWHVPNLSVERAMPSEDLCRLLKAQGALDVSAHVTTEKAFEAALKKAMPEDTILVFGSFYTVSDILPVIHFDVQYLNNVGLYSPRRKEDDIWYT